MNNEWLDIWMTMTKYSSNQFKWLSQHILIFRFLQNTDLLFIIHSLVLCTIETSFELNTYLRDY